MDLFGPLKTSNLGKKYVLCLTDAFTKYAVMIAIDNKEAPTVAKHIFEAWICKFGTPLEFVSDNGKEFCNNLAKELYALLQIKHSTTTPYWPTCH
jgi:transposase InsO family protein